MRLKTVRLAGFKSFVEPTDVHLRARLTAVVGPNGCGKSNVVDAVRWVLGESSARQLRGGELADVIFNGSSARAPAGRASVELVFDNTEGRIAGPYARYTEVSVRRELVRDGDSHYSLNGSRCRRRDVVDLFLGTGLGPRSYAIIEQGMIARLVEARPEELRAHLEEVAGISRYRERRRETEARITDTRENLARLDDVRTEIASRLATLERQVKAAQRYRELRERERTLRAQHLALRLRAVRADTGTREHALAGALAAAGEGEAAAAAQEAALTAAQDHARTAMQAMAQAQQAFYGAGAQVARAQQAQTQARELDARLHADITRAQADTQHLSDQIGRTGARIAALEQATAGDAQALAAAQADVARVQADVQAAETALEQARVAQDQAERRRTALIGAQRGARSRAQDLQERVARTQTRLDRLAQEAGELDAGGWSERAAQLDAAIASHRAAQTVADEALEQAEAAVEAARAATAGAAADLGAARTALAGLTGRLQSERATQKAALQGASALPPALADAPALAGTLRVDAAWRRAAEAVLGPWLRARVVADVAGVARTLTDQRGLAVVEAGADSMPADLRADALARQVSAPCAIADLTGDVRCAPDLEAALAARADLPAGASYVTPQGHRVTRVGIALPPAQAEAGVLDRAAALEALEAEHTQAQARLAECEAAHTAARAAEQQAQAQLGPARAAARSARDALAECTAEHARVQAHGQRTQARAGALTRERAELTDVLAADTPRLERARAEADQAQAALDALGPDDGAHAAGRRTATDALTRARAQLEDARRAVAAHEQTAAGRAAELRTLATSRTDWQTQLAGATGRLAALNADLAALAAQAPALEQAVQDALTERGHAEAALADARRAQEQADHAAAQAAQARTGAEHALRDAHAALAQARAGVGETHTREQGLLEQFRDAGLDAAGALEALPADADEASTRTALEEAERAIARLGAVNLAAPDEHRELSARAEYLSAQHDDLAQALATLEQTMARMDRETRARFKDTFDAINDGFGRLFPRLFGGGEARLELAQDDPLDAGVLLIARPPGKRNASVHALSGGEKALTAIALVFALFELNPAPFCILDEVDAPLDEHNVVRFGELVRDMSARVQFVMITHNRATMEMAGELAGVTMSEPGVSRLVTVDLQQAEALADAPADARA